jgi:hypothetical protein
MRRNPMKAIGLAATSMNNAQMPNGLTGFLTISCGDKNKSRCSRFLKTIDTPRFSIETFAGAGILP